MAKYNRTKCIVYNTFQVYRWDRLDYLRNQIEKAKAGNYLLGAKLFAGLIWKRNGSALKR